MDIAIIGIGNVGSALAGSAVKAGHRVTLAATDPAKVKAKAMELGATAAATPAEAARGAETVILAVPYTAVAEVLAGLGDALAGKIVIDVTNRLNMQALAQGIDGTSAAEQIQQKAPQARVVKAFNYAFASRQADPTVDGTALDGFVASDDEEARRRVLELVGSIGFRPIDAGPLVMARALEALAILNISLQVTNGWPWQSGWKMVGPTPEKKG